MRSDYSEILDGCPINNRTAKGRKVYLRGRDDVGRSAANGGTLGDPSLAPSPSTHIQSSTLNLMQNLTHALKSHMHSKHRLGRANTESIYYQSWQRIKPMADTTISASFLTHAAITHAARKTALNWRFGTLWSNKMAFRCQQSNTMQCPLCG